MFLVLDIAILLFNIIELIILLKKHCQAYVDLSPVERTMISLSFSDLLVGSIGFYHYWRTQISKVPIEVPWIRFLNVFAIQFSMVASIMNLSLLSAERLISVSRPTQYQTIFQRKRVIWLIVGVWTLTVILTSTIVFISSTRLHRQVDNYALLCLTVFCSCALLASYLKGYSVIRQSRINLTSRKSNFCSSELIFRKAPEATDGGIQSQGKTLPVVIQGYKCDNSSPNTRSVSTFIDTFNRERAPGHVNDEDENTNSSKLLSSNTESDNKNSGEKFHKENEAAIKAHTGADMGSTSAVSYNPKVGDGVMVQETSTQRYARKNLHLDGMNSHNTISPEPTVLEEKAIDMKSDMQVKQIQARIKKERRLLLLGLLISTAFVVSFAPFAVYSSIVTFSRERHSQFIILFALARVNSLINPIVFLAFLLRYRR